MSRKVGISLAIVAALVLVFAAVAMAQDATTPTPGQGYGRMAGGQGMMNPAAMGRGWVDADKDGVCDNFTDADGDGVCDNAGAQRMLGRRAGAVQGRGAAQGQGRGAMQANRAMAGRGHGPLFSDADGDGVCDRYSALHPNQTTP